MVASAVTVVERLVCTIGSRLKRGGIGGGPAGFPEEAPFKAKSNFGFLMVTLLPAFSGAPALIHSWMSASSFAGNLSAFGGMKGSDS